MIKSYIVVSIAVILIACLDLVNCNRIGQISKRDSSSDKDCDNHADCYGLFSLESYCCLDSCCNWFEFWRRKIFIGGLDDMGNSDGPTGFTVVIIGVVVLLAALFLCCLFWFVCACKACHELCKCCFPSKRERLLRSGRVLQQPSAQQQRSYTLLEPVVRRPQHSYRTITQPLATTATSTVQPSAPLLDREAMNDLVIQEEIMCNERRAPISRCDSDNEDRPPSYDAATSSYEPYTTRQS